MSLYKLGISDRTMGAAQNSDPEVQKMMLESLQNNTPKDSGGGIMDIIKELFGFGDVEASDLSSISNIGSIANPNFRISNMYDQVYSDPFNVNKRDSEIIIGADGKAKTVPILPMTSDEIMAGSIVPNDFDAQRFQSIFPTSGIMSQTQSVEDDDLESSAIPRFGQDELKQSGGIRDLFRTVAGFLIPGFNALKNFDSQPYQRFDPRASIKGGIYSIGNFNQPASMVNDFYNPRTGLNRFERAQQRYEKTGSLKDLFASSRSGAEFFGKLRERKAAKQKALEVAAKKKRNISEFTSGGGGGGDGPSIADRPATTSQGLTSSQYQAFRN